MANIIELPQDPDQFRAEWEYLLAKFKRDELTPAEEARFEEFEDENDLRYSLAQRNDESECIPWETVERELDLAGRLPAESTPRYRRIA